MAAPPCYAHAMGKQFLIAALLLTATPVAAGELKRCGLVPELGCIPAEHWPWPGVSSHDDDVPQMTQFERDLVD